MLRDHGFLRFQAKTVAEKCNDVTWRKNANFPGSADGFVPPCDAPCTFSSKEAALAAMPHWPEATGFARVRNSTDYVPLNASNLSSSECVAPPTDESDYDEVYAKVCRSGRDPDSLCQKCTAPLVFDTKNPSCKPDDPKTRADAFVRRRTMRPSVVPKTALQTLDSIRVLCAPSA